jgi:hypothetical protein
VNALFVNYPEPACGVAQFGRNLWAILKDSGRVRWHYAEPSTVGELRTYSSMPDPDVVVYNWQSGQGGFLNEAPFSWLNAQQYLVYHDNDINENAWSGIFFSDPAMTPRGNWHVIGRPLPAFNKLSDRPVNATPTFGCHGFLGTWADQVVHRVMQEFEYAKIRLSLPYATYGDSHGDAARAMADRCRNMVVNNPGITLEISHDFLHLPQLLEWLAANDMNVYIRPTSMHWRGVSSAPDSALAVNRPIAVNKCSAFRHLHNLSPSICIEDRSLIEIFSNGLSPLVGFKAKWCSPEIIRDQIECVLMKL